MRHWVGSSPLGLSSLEGVMTGWACNTAPLCCICLAKTTGPVTERLRSGVRFLVRSLYISQKVWRRWAGAVRLHHRTLPYSFTYHVTRLPYGLHDTSSQTSVTYITTICIKMSWLTSVSFAPKMSSRRCRRHLYSRHKSTWLHTCNTLFTFTYSPNPRLPWWPW